MTLAARAYLWRGLAVVAVSLAAGLAGYGAALATHHRPTLVTVISAPAEPVIRGRVL